MKTQLSVLALLALLYGPVAAAQEAKKDDPPAKTDAAKGDTAKAEPAKQPTVSEAEAKKAEELFEDGRKLFFQADYAGAAAKLQQAVEANPTKTSYRLLLAKALRNAKQPDKAMTQLEEILKANADHVEAAVELAEMLSPQKQPDRVIAVLEPLLKFKHDYPLYHLLAEAHYQKEQFDKARTYYEEAVKLNPKSASDHYQVGNIYLAQKRFAKAAEAYETAGRLGMSSGVYHFKLASVYFNLHNYLGNIGTAEVLGGKTGEIKNEWFLVDPVPGKKDTFYAAGPRSAIYQVVKAQQMGIDIFEIRFLEANVWLNARRFANADRIYQALAEKVKKEDAGLFWYHWSQTALGLEDYDAYLARLNKAIASDPDVYKSMLADALVTVANRHHQKGDSAKFLEYLGKAVATNPLSARMHLMLGDAEWVSSRKEKAIEQYRLVLELEPDHAERVRLLNRIRGQEDVAGVK